MIDTIDGKAIYGNRYLRKDLGVLLVVALALALGWLLFQRTTTQTKTFQPQDAPIRLAYPAGWVDVESLQDVLLKVEDPLTDSEYKTTLTVESRLLDPQSLPTVQSLLDRRVETRQQLTGYHFLANQETTVGGAKGMEMDYAYVVQPIDTPRRASLPVVVQAREVILITQDRSYYITLAAPATDYARASAQFDRLLQTVQVQ